MILGDRCTRRCTFCNVKKKRPLPVDEGEPFRLLEAVRVLGIRYVVLTSPVRDDLPDGGASHFARCVRVLKKGVAGIRVEVLVPDFMGNTEALEVVLSSGPDVFSHNVETVPRLYRRVRTGSSYRRSLGVLRNAKKIAPHVPTKSALILGFGESFGEIVEVLKDLRSVGCDFLTVGQYYQPSLRHHPVVKYYSEMEFERIKEVAYKLGFRFVASGPNVRSSYKAFEGFVAGGGAS